jgi:hypothetical protein
VFEDVPCSLRGVSWLVLCWNYFELVVSQHVVAVCIRCRFEIDTASPTQIINGVGGP